jgi:hypothetical protein
MITRLPDGTFRVRFLDKVRTADTYAEAYAILTQLEDGLNEGIGETYFDFADDEA